MMILHPILNSMTGFRKGHIIRAISLPPAAALLILSFLATFWGLPTERDVQAATYYVDFVGGSDANSGTSTSAAWKHSPGDSNASGTPRSTSLSAGDAVIFKGGVSYLGQMTVSRSGSVVVSGSRGSVTSSGVLADSANPFGSVTTSHIVYIYHSKASQSNTWVESVGLFPISSVDSTGQITLSGFDGKAYSGGDMTYKILNPITFRSDPSWGTGYATIDGEGARQYGFFVQGNDVLYFKGLRFYNTSSPTSDTYTGAIYANDPSDYLMVDSCRFETIGQSGVGSYNGKWSVVKDSYFDDIGFTAATWPANYLLFSGNTVNNACRAVLNPKGYSVIRYNSVSNLNRDYYGLHSHFIQVDWSSGTEYGWIIGNYLYQISMNIYFTSATGGGQTYPRYWTVANNVVVGTYNNGSKSGCGDLGTCAICLGGAHYINVYNNTISGAEGCHGFIQAIQLTTDSSYCAIENNIVHCNGTNCQASVLVDTGANNPTHTFDYNHYYSDRVTPMQVGTNGLTLAQWQAAGLDLHGIPNLTTSPNFVSVASQDFRLGQSSIDRSVGPNLSAFFSLDKSGTARPSPGGYSLGAYEPTSVGLAAPMNLRINQ